MAKLKCAICGQEFESSSGNSKYCSMDCRQAGRYRKRKEWEERTDYKEKQRIAVAEYRAEQEKKAEKEAKAADRRRKCAETRARHKREREEIEELEKKAKKGDRLAKLRLAMYKGDILEYWKQYRDIIIEEDERLGKVSKATIGGISAYDDAFEYKVLELIKEQAGGADEAGAERNK